MTFQRARTEEQREARRQAILEAAAAMLEEMPVADVSLNELSRRVGLAKSNVLRYFDSREGVLLELLTSATREWVGELSRALPALDPAAPLPSRAEQVADVVARTLSARRVLCDLVGAQGSVLEHNVTVDVVRHHKHVAHRLLAEVGELLRGVLPELGASADVVGFQVAVFAAALAPYSSPSAAVLAAYAADPGLAALHQELPDSLRQAVRTVLLGALPRT
ncbi:TetR family transcriptional regulator [Kineococcus rhizosphaerae]|uniref:TetR family transcriptional regulator n=1 Tax=Kineococcus rhizosphaerae TaxID=559628 RepID=A0A2T0QXV2_9ACTN|nr:TetR family transcriptional regulator [Kineococcus rhizosphaerae]PRY10784.1 TetR family transcriptional regulator [Kineococcus rhizosphaerae]